jgi:cobalt-zinc-cadmium efflux system membrane fusion protein
MNPRSLVRTRVFIAAVTVVSIIGCTPKTDNHEAPPATNADNVRLTPAQQQNIHLYSVALSKFRRTVEASGVVDFDNNLATSVLAPISGPVSRLLVSLGDHVKQGAPLALVDSPDFASAVSTYRKALATAQTARRLADLDKDLVAHEGVSKREASG